MFDPDLNETRVDSYDFEFGELKDNLTDSSSPEFVEDMDHDPDQDIENDRCALMFFEKSVLLPELAGD